MVISASISQIWQRCEEKGAFSKSSFPRFDQAASHNRIGQRPHRGKPWAVLQPQAIDN
jgi:hypothetical protein